MIAHTMHAICPACAGTLLSRQGKCSVCGYCECRVCARCKAKAEPRERVAA